MTEIKSSLGQTFSGSKPGRVLTVEDESQPKRPIRSFDEGPARRVHNYQERTLDEEEIKENERRRAEALEMKKRVSPEAKERIIFLTELGRIKKSVEVEGLKFTLQSLKGFEQSEVFDSLSQFVEMSALRMQYEVRFQTLARAISHIQDKPFSEVIESNDIADKLELVRNLDENVSDHLYKWYQKNIVEFSQEKYAIKDEEDVKEVAESVKKS